MVANAIAPLLALSSKLSENEGFLTPIPRKYWVLVINENVKTISYSRVVLLTVVVQGLVRLLMVHEEGRTWKDGGKISFKVLTGIEVEVLINTLRVLLVLTTELDWVTERIQFDCTTWRHKSTINNLRKEYFFVLEIMNEAIILFVLLLI